MPLRDYGLKVRFGVFRLDKPFCTQHRLGLRVYGLRLWAMGFRLKLRVQGLKIEGLQGFVFKAEPLKAAEAHDVVGAAATGVGLS